MVPRAPRGGRARDRRPPPPRRGFSWQTYTMDVAWRSAETGEQRARLRGAGRAARRPARALRHRRPVPRSTARSSTTPTCRCPSLLARARPGGARHAVLRDGAARAASSRCSGAATTRAIFPTEAARRAIGLQFVDVAGADPRRRLARGRARPPGARVADPVASASCWIDHWAGYYEDSVLVELPLMRYAIGVAARERRVLRAARRSATATTGSATSCSADGTIVGDLRLGAGARRRPGRGHRLLRAAAVPRPQPAALAAARPRRVLRALRGADRACGSTPTCSASGPCSASSRRPRRTCAASRAFEEGRIGDLRLAAMGHQVQYVLRHIARELGLEEAAA